MKRWIVILMAGLVLSLGAIGCEPEDIEVIGQKIERVAVDAEYQLTSPESDVQRTTGEVVGIAQTTGAIVKSVPWIPYREVILAITSVVELLGLIILGWRKKQTTQTLGAVVRAIGLKENEVVVKEDWDDEKEKYTKTTTTIGEVIKPVVAQNLQHEGLNRQGSALIKDAKNY